MLSNQTMLICVFLLVFAQVSTSSFVLHNIAKRHAERNCSCSNSSRCAPKYELFPGHTACLNKSAVAKPIALTDAEKKEIVDQHNQLRSSVKPAAANMLKMKWDPELEMLAKRWVEACQIDIRGYILSDKVRNIPGRFDVGQNSATDYSTIKETIDEWFEERHDYTTRYSNVELFQWPGPEISHYTQLAWASSSLIGCAASWCNKMKYFVCDYGPTGNIFPFKSPYEKLEYDRASCKNSTSSENLCDCGALACQNDAKTNALQCSCNCTYPSQVPPYCALDCSKDDDQLCGRNEFQTKHCNISYIVAACPHLCGICPCSDAKYSCYGSGGSDSDGHKSDSNINHVGHVFTQMIAVFLLALLF
ncbi:hypothetical protein BsWGS_06629 [Bradybaena similaris]